MKELKAHKLVKQINELEQELRSAQDKCKHKKATKKAGCNTGNFCPYDDVYWYDFECPTCLKKWRLWQHEYHELHRSGEIEY